MESIAVWRYRMITFPYGTSIEDILLKLRIVMTNSHVRRLTQQGAIKAIREGKVPVKLTSPTEPLEAGRIELRIGKSKFVKVLIEKEICHD